MAAGSVSTVSIDRKWEKPSQDTAPTKKFISIVVPCLNEELVIGDFVDWCFEGTADSGVYLKNTPQIQMWNSPPGSGGLFNNKVGAKNPLVVADNPVGRWNSFHIIQRNSDMTTIWLNGQLVVDNVKMEYYWDYSKPLPAKGNIELQFHGTKLFWKNIYVKELN